MEMVRYGVVKFVYRHEMIWRHSGAESDFLKSYFLEHFLHFDVLLLCEKYAKK